MFGKYTSRFIHTYRSCWASDKSLLATLRKKTGYTFSNCKKALEMHNNDVTKAEQWLKEQAQALGWSKATKLEGRSTLQGLVGVAVNHNSAAIVEVNCETDFVARNENFQKMVSNAVISCLKYCESHKSNNSLTKIGLDAEQLKQLKSITGKSLADELALMIGTLGENATLRRAMCFHGDGDLCISGYVHPSGKVVDKVLLGKFGALVAVRKAEGQSSFANTIEKSTTDENTMSQNMTDETDANEHTFKPLDINEVALNICQHVVGMNPKRVGSEADKPAANSDEERCLIYQEYLNDNSVSVKEILVENGVEVIEFKRFECGEPLVEENFGQPADDSNVCQ